MFVKSLFSTRRYMAEFLWIRRKTLSNQSINEFIFQTGLYILCQQIAAING